jgi:hypothetical protein
MVCAFNGDRAAVVRAIEDWRSERSTQVKGFIDVGVLFTDDNKTLINYVMFLSKRDYLAQADDPRQDEWYRTRILPTLTGEPTWNDGEWAEFVE